MSVDQSMTALRERHERYDVWERKAVDGLERRRVYQARRGLARVAEYLAMKMLLEEGVRCRSSRQTDLDLPDIRHEMARRDLWLPPMPGLTDELIDIGEIDEEELDVDGEVAA